MGDETGNVAFVTGAASGMGRAIAHELARNGARIFAVDCNSEGLRKTVATLPTTADIHSMTGDLAAADEITEMSAAAKEAVGRVNILVNNAALTGDNRPILEETLDRWNRWFAVNVTSHLLLAQAFVRG